MLLKVRVKKDGLKFDDVTRRVRQLDPDAYIMRALKGDDLGDDDMAINKLLSREFGLAHDATENDLAEAIVRDRRASKERIADLQERVGETHRALTQDVARNGGTRSTGRTTIVTASDEIMRRATELASKGKMTFGAAIAQVATEDPRGERC